MFDQVIHRLGLDWRIPRYRRWWMYARICSNFVDIIQHQRDKNRLRCLDLRGIGPVHFSDPDQALQMLDEIWVQRIYTREFCASSPKTVVDIGANIGLFTLFAGNIWQGSTIHAYEPFPGNFELLGKNVSLMRSASVRTYACAVAGQTGSLPFFVKAESGWHSLYATEDEVVKQQIDVATVSLSEVIASVSGWIDFLKIDCEGGEWSLFTDQAQMLARTVGYIAMEYHEIDGHTHIEIVEMLRSAGFNVKISLPDAWKTGLLYAENSYAHRPG